MPGMEGFARSTGLATETIYETQVSNSSRSSAADVCERLGSTELRDLQNESKRAACQCLLLASGHGSEGLSRPQHVHAGSAPGIIGGDGRLDPGGKTDRRWGQILLCR